MKFGIVLILIVYSIGVLQEIFERIVLKRVGHGMWGWTIPSLIYLFTLCLINRYDLILSLGGPTSSNLSTALVSNVLRIPSVIEFQDPIVGEDIGHNFRLAIYFRLLETFLVSSRSSLIFVTKQAAIECQERHPSANNIGFIYSSSAKSNIVIDSKIDIPKNNLSIQIAYFGEIYSTRNYD